MIERRVCVLTNGCPENMIDSARVIRFFKKNGWIVTYDHRVSDLIVFNACGITESTAKDSLNIIKKIQKEKKKSSKFIVWGCLPKIDPNALMQVYNGPCFGEKEIATFNHFAYLNSYIEEINANYLIPKYSLYKYGNSFFSLFIQKTILKYYRYLGRIINVYAGTQEGNQKNFFIKVATGCDGNCTFCAVRNSRGYIRSKPIEKIMCEFREGSKKGFKRFTLLGTDLGPYGIDLGYKLVHLLNEMTSEKGNYKIALRNVNPFFLKKMLSELIPIFKSNKIWFMSCAVESGSNRILKLMNRKYCIEEFKECMQDIQNVSPKTLFRTQIMVGFPTETEQDFRESMRLLDEVVFDFVEVYKYSERPRTLALSMQGQIPQKIKNIRYGKLIMKYLFQRIPRKMKVLASMRKIS